MTATRYPIYVPSKGRWQPERALTAKALMRDDVPFWLVVEPPERDAYEQLVGRDRVLVLPFADRGTSTPARNWIKDHATERGWVRHWQLDDNIIEFRRLYRGRRIPCDAAAALGACEEFTDRYENVAISGLNYQMFVTRETREPYYLNVHVYSCTLMLNEVPYRWRLRYNEDTDICLQALADGWCTVLLNAFMANKLRTMAMSGGNTDQLYGGDGRLEMAQTLERAWPGVVKVTRRFGRPQHTVDWRKFDTPLKRREGFDPATLPRVNERGLRLRAVREVESPALRRIAEERGDG